MCMCVNMCVFQIPQKTKDTKLLFPRKYVTKSFIHVSIHLNTSCFAVLNMSGTGSASGTHGDEAAQVLTLVKLLVSLCGLCCILPFFDKETSRRECLISFHTE